MVYIWSDQESVDELKHKLLCINYELESAKIRANLELSKNEEITKQLINLLKVAYQERDEAKYQLQKLLNTFLPISAESETSPIISEIHNETPITPKASDFSTVQESDVVSKTCSYTTTYSFASDSTNLGGYPKKAVDQGYDESIQVAAISSSNMEILNRADALIDNIVKAKPLPEKGKLLQALMDNEPLVQSLFVAPLPKWKNPPPLPPMTNSSNLIYRCDLGSLEQTEAVNPFRAIQGSSSLIFSHIPSSSVLNFAHGLNNGTGDSSAELMHCHNGSGERRRRSS